MSTDVSLFFASVNIACADPAGQANFWGKVLGKEVEAGMLEGVWLVGTTDEGSRPQMVFFPAPEEERVIGGFIPTLVTEHHEQETKRLTGLGAKVLDEAYHAPIRLTTFADPEGNKVQLATFQPE
jgi:predicted enzyme related to lactoylglutathione lyase